MNFEKLSKVYTKITGKQVKELYLEDLVVKCYLSNKFRKFVPHIGKLYRNPMRLLVESEKYFDRQSYDDSPTLLAVLCSYKKFRGTLKYILENWKKFYTKVSILIEDILYTYSNDYYISGNIDFASKTTNMIIVFCLKYDLIDNLNRWQAKGISIVLNFNFIHYLVCWFDTKTKYQVINPTEFITYFMHNGKSIEEVFTKYNILSLCTPRDLEDMLENALCWRNAEDFLYLHSIGARYTYRPLAALTGFDPRVMDTVKYNDDFDLGKLVTSAHHGRYQCYLHLDDILNLIEYLVKDIDLFMAGILSTCKVISRLNMTKFYLIYTKFKEEQKICSDTIMCTVRNYSVSEFPRYGNSIKLWKCNFKLLFQLQSNLTTCQRCY